MGWFDSIIQKLTNGKFSIGGMIKISAAGIVTERDRYFTQQGVARIYQVEEMPREYSKDLVSQVTKRLAKLDPRIVVKTYYEVDNAYVSYQTPQFVAKMNRSIQQYLEYKEAFETLPKEIQQSGVYQDNGARRWSFSIKDVMKKKHRYDSYVNVNNHLRNNAGVYFLVSVFFMVIYKDQDMLNGLDSQVSSILRDEVAQVDVCDKAVATVLSNFSPTVMNSGNMRPKQLLASELNLTQLMGFRSEGILSTSGIPLGTNVGNNTPLWIDLFSKPEGAATIICAKAGKGKSFLGYVYACQLVGAGNTIIYIDIKGTEVSRCLGAVMDSLLTIDFSEKSSVFVNTMHVSKFVPDYTVEDAINVTAEMLAIFVNLLPGDEGNPADLMNILKHAVRSYYNEVGVVPGVVDTYINSETMTYYNLLSYIGHQRVAESDDRLKDMFNIITDRLTEAIIHNHMKTNENAIKLDDLFGYSAIVFAFNKNTDITITIIDQVRIYMSLMVTKRLAKYNRQNELFTCFVLEEAQRVLEMSALCTGVSGLASGSRSDNLNVTAIMNDLNVMKTDSLSSLRSNIANFIIGSCDDQAVEILEKIFAKKQLAEDVREIIQNPRKFERTFAVHFEIGSTEINSLVKCDVPKELADAFKTRSFSDDVEVSSGVV